MYAKSSSSYIAKVNFKNLYLFYKFLDLFWYNKGMKFEYDITKSDINKEIGTGWFFISLF